MVYVSKQDRKYYRYIMSMMIADTLQELMDMATLVGVDHKWRSEHKGIPLFWICKEMKVKAIAAGADVVNERWMLEQMNKKEFMNMGKTTKKIEEIIAGEECPLPIEIIPNNMGISLSSVESISWDRQEDGQLTQITINFTPDPH